MTTSTDWLICYSLSTGGPRAALAAQQLVRSVASLRAHNRAVPVRLFLCGALEGAAQRELEANDVTIEDLGDYEAHLGTLCPPRMSEVLARYPLLHKSTFLRRLGAAPPAPSRLLVIDGDTLFFHDVDLLFDRYAELDLYAREEPFSRACAFGYRPELIDEDALGALASREGARVIAPFNNGVMLWNHGAWRLFAERIEEMLRYVFRFSVWLADRVEAPTQRDIVHLREHRSRLVEAADEALALPFPSRNAWIRDEVARWLTLGKIQGLRVGTLARHDVLQGSEFERMEPGRQIMVHYFSGLEEQFSAWLADRTPPAPVAAAPSRAGPGGPAGPSTRAPSIHALEELGPRLDEAWQRLDHDELAFPALAAGALRDAQIHRTISGVDVVRWLLAAREIPVQDDIEATFGHPPVTIYHGPRFYIQVLLWTEGTTSIHRHGFSGAFLVLDGLSLHARYAFEPRRRVSSRMSLGDVRRRSAALIGRGDVVEITHDLIHSTFHLDVPTVTVVVRTYRDGDAAIQYEYMPPTVAVDPFFEDPATRRRLQALQFLRRTKQPGHVELAADLVARSDLHTAWVVLLDAYRQLGSAARAAPILAAARARHGAAADELAAALGEELRRRKLRQVRDSVNDPSERFFLALLQNLPDREAIEAVVRQRYPEVEPRARIVAWLEALSGAGVVGVDLSDRLSREIVLAMLDGRSTAGVLERLEAVFDPRDVHARAEGIAQHCARIQRTTLGPLFVDR